MRAWSGSDRRYPPFKRCLVNKNSIYLKFTARAHPWKRGCRLIMRNCFQSLEQVVPRVPPEIDLGSLRRESNEEAAFCPCYRLLLQSDEYCTRRQPPNLARHSAWR